jgi:ferredoxin
MRVSTDQSAHLRIDPIACDGIGICTHLAPNLIRVDSWGYPILSGQTLTKRDRKAAESAVAACPRRALFIAEGGSSAR